MAMCIWGREFQEAKMIRAASAMESVWEWKGKPLWHNYETAEGPWETRECTVLVVKELDQELRYVSGFHSLPRLLLHVQIDGSNGLRCALCGVGVRRADSQTSHGASKTLGVIV